MKRILLAIAIIPLAFVNLTANADSPLQQPPAAVERSIVLVRVLALDGTGPDNREHRLFSDTQGFVTTLDALGRVGYQVGGKGLGEGGYHTLFAELADEYEHILPDGTRLLQRFSDDSKPRRIRVRGMIMVRDGQATPLRMLEDPSYYGSRRGAFRRGYEDDD